MESLQGDTVDYLIKAASILPTENYAQKLLKSFYLTKSRKLLQKDNQQQKSLFSDEEVCRKCSTPWSDTNYSLAINSITMAKSKARKIRTQIECKGSRKNQMAKKSAKKANNIITIKCNLCSHANKIILWKKSTDLRKIESEKIIQQPGEKIVHNKSSSNIEDDSAQQPSKRKKRKRDKNAGLLYALNKSDQTVVKVNKEAKQVVRQNVQHKGHINPQNNQSQKSGQFKSNISIGKKKATVHMVTNTIPIALQKKTNFLQLANALKTKGNQSTSNSDNNNKLRQMLG